MSIYNWVKKLGLDGITSDSICEAYRFLNHHLINWKMPYRSNSDDDKFKLEVEVGGGPDPGKMQILEMIVNQTETKLPEQVIIRLGGDAILPRDTGDYYMEVTFSTCPKDDDEGWVKIE